MSILNSLTRFLADPAPDYVFEISEGGIAYARPGAQPAFEPFEPGVISATPIAENVLRPDAFADKVRQISGGGGGRKRKRAILILPDYCARTAVLEFDSFPSDPKEQLALVRFRMKKSVPFDVESAVVSYHPQPAKSGTKSVDVIVVVAALEIIARYEAPFRNAGLHPGSVTISVLPMIDLDRSAGISVLARMSGRTLTVAVLNSGVLKLVRCVELPHITHEEVSGVLFPTVAYVEDELVAKPSRLLVCGLDELVRIQELESELAVPVQPLESRLGVPNQSNAGLLGYLQSVSEGGASKVA
jgi:type IV pilus assembly protein PilM